MFQKSTPILYADKWTANHCMSSTWPYAGHMSDPDSCVHSPWIPAHPWTHSDYTDYGSLSNSFLPLSPPPTSSRAYSLLPHTSSVFALNPSSLNLSSSHVCSLLSSPSLQTQPLPPSFLQSSQTHVPITPKGSTFSETAATTQYQVHTAFKTGQQFEWAVLNDPFELNTQTFLTLYNTVYSTNTWAHWQLLD